MKLFMWFVITILLSLIGVILILSEVEVFTILKFIAVKAVGFLCVTLAIYIGRTKLKTL